MKFQRLAITTVASLLALGGLGTSDVFGQEDPFAPAANPFGAPDDDPFAAPSPFGAPAQPAPAAAPDPFAPATPASPFGAPAAPASPFGAPGAPASPFGAPGAMDDDPFGAPAPVGIESPDSADGAMTVPSPGAANIFSPFGGGTSPFGTDMSAISEDVNPNGISQLFDFRYEQILRWDGEIIVARRQLTKEEADRFDQARIARYTEQALAGELENYAGGDPGAWAQWTHFAEQTRLWGQYIDRVVMAGARVDENVESTYSLVQWPGTPDAIRNLGGNGAAQPAADTNIINQAQNRSLDEQVNDFNPFAGMGGGGPQGGGDIPFITMYQHMVDIYARVDNALREMEAEQEQFMTEFEDRLFQRATARLAYRDWMDLEQESLLEFVQDWDRRYNGTITTIAGVRYELYRPGQVPSSLSPNANVIVTDYQLTPYDILDPETGLLRD